MKSYQTENIINFSLCGHSATGKTTLAEAMAFNTKLINRIGTIDDGNTLSDYHDDEIARQHSIFSTLISLEWDEKKFNMIDVPGYLDFQGEVKSSLRVADFAAVVVSATGGIEVGTELAWDFTEKDYSIPKMLIVNLLDRDNANFDNVLAQAQSRFGNKVFPIQIPINPGEGFNKIADILRKEQYTFKTDGSGDYTEGALEGDWADKCESLHGELIELIAESDDKLLEIYFDQGELSEEQLRNGIHNAITTGGLIPVFCVSGKNNIGVKRMMDLIAKYAPNASDVKEIVATKSGTDDEIKLKTSISEPTTAFVFKTAVEPHVGELSYFRVYSGSIKSGSDIFNVDKNSSEKMRQIYFMSGNKRTDANEIVAGDIGAALKLKNTHTGDSFATSKNQVTLAGIKFPNPNIRFAILPKSKGDEDKISEGLSMLHEEDPTFNYIVDPELKQTIISGQGELHLDVLMKRLKAKFNVELEMIAPKIPYRETITAPSSAKYRHKKQSGGAGQFAEVWMKIEPRQRGEGIEFTESLVGQNVDRVFVPSVEKGVTTACTDGIIAGCRVVDIKIDFYDGKMHPVDSKDIAFQMAGKQAFMDAFKNARPKLLEPIYKIQVKVPDEIMGDVMGDISQRRGKVGGMDADGHFQIINAEVPLANLNDYSTAIRSMSQGRGMFTMEFSHYEDMPHVEAGKVISAYQKERQGGQGEE
ncbi:MAG: elongation factor G [Candidatus Marinimicrobia bacterium]|nr:elongation factor G [Candidatus Neomarinimicrobiota bacterium]MBL7023540.1 elongation factor G [Candidatus Neomarinimicrobiota bacterium]MBL7109564.1 elongation factor G [Candidatus Neomarinimicrobiota bacterium]